MSFLPEGRLRETRSTFEAPPRSASRYMKAFVGEGPLSDISGAAPRAGTQRAGLRAASHLRRGNVPPGSKRPISPTMMPQLHVDVEVEEEARLPRASPRRDR